MDFVGSILKSSNFNVDAAPFSQASLAERSFLHGYIAQEYTGRGAIVELGVGGGGTAYALCGGLSENKDVADKAGRVHLFDWYQLGAGKFANKSFFRADHKEDEGASFEDDVRRNLEPFAGFFEIHNGDITTVEVPESIQEIEVLHIDIAKILLTHKAVFNRFFPSLMVGGLGLHQDFASPSLSWIHYSTAYILPHIEILSAPIRSTLPFKLKEKVPGEVLRRVQDDDFTADEKVSLIQGLKTHITADRSGTLPYTAVFDMSCAYVLHRAGRLDEASVWTEKSAQEPYIVDRRAAHLKELRSPPKV